MKKAQDLSVFLLKKEIDKTIKSDTIGLLG